MDWMRRYLRPAVGGWFPNAPWGRLGRPVRGMGFGDLFRHWGLNPQRSHAWRRYAIQLGKQARAQGMNKPLPRFQTPPYGAYRGLLDQLNVDVDAPLPQGLNDAQVQFLRKFFKVPVATSGPHRGDPKAEEWAFQERLGRMIASHGGRDPFMQMLAAQPGWQKATAQTANTVAPRAPSTYGRQAAQRFARELHASVQPVRRRRRQAAARRRRRR